MNQNETLGVKKASNMCTCVCEWVARSFLESPGFRRANNRFCLWDLSWAVWKPLSHFEFCKTGEGRQARKQKDKGHWKPRELDSGTLLFSSLLSLLLCKISVILTWRKINRNIVSREIFFSIKYVSYRIFHFCKHSTSD